MIKYLICKRKNVPILNHQFIPTAPSCFQRLIQIYWKLVAPKFKPQLVLLSQFLIILSLPSLCTLFSMPNLKIKLRLSQQHPSQSLQQEGKVSFDSPFSISSEEVEHLHRSTELQRQKHFEPLETVLNARFNARKSQNLQIFLPQLPLVPSLAKYQII